jgi:hypothetical protein
MRRGGVPSGEVRLILISDKRFRHISGNGFSGTKKKNQMYRAFMESFRGV